MGRAAGVLAAVMAVLVMTGCAGADEPSLAVGDCINLTGDVADQGQYPPVECSERHDAEVFAVFEFGWDQPYNEEAMGEQIDQICMPLFVAYVGIDYWESFLDFNSIMPSPDAWEAGQRQVSCMLYEIDYDTLKLVPLKGSERGSAR